MNRSPQQSQWLAELELRSAQQRIKATVGAVTPIIQCTQVLGLFLPNYADKVMTR